MHLISKKRHKKFKVRNCWVNTKSPSQKTWTFSFVPQAQHHLTEGQHHYERSEYIIVRLRTQTMLQQVANDVVLRTNEVAVSANDVMLRINDVGLRPMIKQLYFRKQRLPIPNPRPLPQPLASPRGVITARSLYAT